MLKGLAELLKKVREKAAEFTDEQFDEELNKLLPESWIPKNKFNELNDAKKLADDQLKQANDQLKDLEKNASLTDEQKKQLTDLQAKMDEQKQNYEKELMTLRKNHAIDTALGSAKAKNAKAVRALLDESKIVLGEDGSVSGLKEQLEAVQKDNDYLFEVSGGTQDPGKPRFGGTPGEPSKTGDAALQARFAEKLGIKQQA